MAHGGEVGLRFADGHAAAAGVVTCGRIWLCPVCNSKVMASRALDVGMVLAYAESNGLLVGWGSLTVRHNIHDLLDRLIKLQSLAWWEVTNSVAWRAADALRAFDYLPHVHGDEDDPCDEGDCTRARARHNHVKGYCPKGCRKRFEKVLGPFPGRIGYVRASEINYGDNGWHPHFHPIILWVGSRESFQRWLDDVVTEWIVGVEKFGGEALRNGGQQLRALEPGESFKRLDKYVTKGTYALALEAVWSQSKTGRKSAGTKSRDWSTQPHWTLLARIAVGKGDAADIEKWWHLEESVHGHRMIAWSRTLRRLAGLGAERTEEEIAAEEHGSAEDTVCFISAQGWADLAQHPEIVGEIMTTLEQGGWAGLRGLLTAWKIDYRLPDPPKESARMTDTLADRLADYLA